MIAVSMLAWLLVLADVGGAIALVALATALVGGRRELRRLQATIKADQLRSHGRGGVSE